MCGCVCVRDRNNAEHYCLRLLACHFRLKYFRETTNRETKFQHFGCRLHWHKTESARSLILTFWFTSTFVKSTIVVRFHITSWHTTFTELRRNSCNANYSKFGWMREKESERERSSPYIKWNAFAYKTNFIAWLQCWHSFATLSGIKTISKTISWWKAAIHFIESCKAMYIW